MLDFIRIACAVPAVQVGDTKKNASDICAYIERADAQDVDLLVFPETALTGYTCQDLFLQDVLYNGVKAGVQQIIRCTKNHPDITAIVGLPVRQGANLFNCAGVFRDGALRGLTAKTYLPNYKEFYEKRWFCSAQQLRELGTPAPLPELDLLPEEGGDVPIQDRLLVRLGEGVKVGIEICEDLWTPIPPSNLLALAGAEVIVNLSASNETIGKADDRRLLVRHQSASLNCVYAYCSAGCTESTQDLIFSGQSIIAENGSILAQSAGPVATDYLLVQDCDLGRVRSDRRKNKSFKDSADVYAPLLDMTVVDAGKAPLRSDGSLYRLKKLPFVPSDHENRILRCREIFGLQVAGLKQRLISLGNTNVVIGISGGLDSTLALLVSVEAMRQLGRPVTDIYAVTMPCFGTSDRTYRNSWALMEALGVSRKEINIRQAVEGHFADIGHDPALRNTTYENAQARERTQVLMDYAGVVNGIVIGTGDLSELALGWCTYNGDQMSMYSVNASIPKTLLRWMIEALSESPEFAPAGQVLRDILDTPISPELLPPDGQGHITQNTEDVVGPYALHDFFLYYTLRFGYTPKKIYALACRAFAGEFDGPTIRKWLSLFYSRFFAQQFKRSCMPDGVKVGSVSLNPRGDWRMPSDAAARLWLDELAEII